MTLLTALPAPGSYRLAGTGRWCSVFAVTELANASIAAAGLELAQLISALNLAPVAPEVTVDQRLASLWFSCSLRPVGWELPSLWDPIAGNYQAADGWIRLHTNLPHHRRAALQVLGCEGNRSGAEAAVRHWQAGILEKEIVTAGGAAAAMRSRTDWLAHPQGSAVAAEPLIHWISPRKIQLRNRPEATADRPLAGLRVLDLTRVLAGPVSTRTLAGFGAEVLRIDPPGWDEPGVISDISLGKRMASLDLRSNEGRQRFETLLSNTDVLVHGYRPGVLDGLGYGADARRRIAPNAVEVTLDAYGWTGPWAQRRGFDSLVQMSAGIAETGRVQARTGNPHPLPVQALDHATGYLMAAAVLSALAAAAQGEEVPAARLSLARTAELLAGLQKYAEGLDLTKPADSDYNPEIENSGWGPGRRLAAPLGLDTSRMRWDRPASRCGSAPACWPQ
ncbi:CoA transferase [Leisingera methylohalidivorans]|uniref:CAIB/BAIF family CoA transferase n=1 Tax=Leisingera methylohalidivorans DSM 14336 TaxID=999552 RepID=V9VM50_9RHOB|nr:CoA transferase [Leisingera methylohalidivorans]AHC99655.1 CAIB/BAIF family CoA transferase [Leisingera methylohalidivorans DSM 14336]